MKHFNSLKKTFKLAAAAAITPAALMAQDVGGGAAAGFSLGPVGFGAPLVLMGLASLPLLWWWMRTVPPKPKQERFPAIRFLFNLKAEDSSPVRMPVWHRVLRLAAAGLAIVGLSAPAINPRNPIESKGKGPLIVLAENDWASARGWDQRTKPGNMLFDRAAHEGRQVIVLSDVKPEDGGPVRLSGPTDAESARKIFSDLKPEPWPADRQGALEALKALDTKGDADVVWFSDGLDGPGAQSLEQRLGELGKLTVLEDSAQAAANLLSPPDTASDTLTVNVRRPSATPQGETVILVASNEAGQPLSRVEARFEKTKTESTAAFNVPPEVRDQLVRVSIEGEKSAGATLLLDEHWRRRPVGLVNAGVPESVQPLLNESAYIGQALGPYVDLKRGSVDDLLKDKLAVIIMTDAVTFDQATHDRIEAWVRNGGTLLRFAGPRLAAHLDKTNDDLLPVGLLPGQRVLGGGFSGGKPGTLAPFGKDSPFFGIRQSPDITVTGEVQAQPSADLDRHVWARLDDGTPLVTAAAYGEGWKVLVHTTADTNGSNLVLSGTFVDMGRAIVAHSQGVAGGTSGIALPPLKTLDGSGQLGDPPPAVLPLTREVAEAGTIGPQNPPGFYGNESVRQALNLSAAVPDMKPLAVSPENAAVKTYESVNGATDLSGALLAGALSLLLADIFLRLSQAGALPGRKKKPQDDAPRTPVPQAAP